MSRTVVRWLAGGLGVLLTAIPLLAHHNITGKFDPAKTRTLNGVVTRLDWANPHVHILMDVVEGNTVKNWAVELESTLDLERSGWNLNTLKPGDAVTVQGMLARDGSPQIWGDSVVLTAGNKRVLNVSEAAKAFLRPVANLPARATPRWPDGKPRLGPEPGEKGYWARPSATTLMEAGVRVETNEHGLLKNIADAGKVAPMQPWAKALFESAAAQFPERRPDVPVLHAAGCGASVPATVRRAVSRGQDLPAHLPGRGWRQPHLAFHLQRWPAADGRDRRQ